MKALEIRQKLKTSVANFYQLGGDDEYLKRYVVESIVSLIPPESQSLCYEVIEDNCDINQLLNAVNTPSFLGDIKVVEVRGFKTKLTDNDKRNLIDYVENPNENNILIICDCGDTFGCISDYVVKVECDKADSDQLTAYIKSCCLAQEVEIQPLAVKNLIKYSGGNFGKITQELDKLMTYCMPNKTITNQDVEDITTQDEELKIFKIIDALQNGDIQKALDAHKALIERGDSPVLIFSIILKAYRNMLEIAISGSGDDTLCKVLGISYYALNSNRKIVDKAKKTQSGYVGKLKKNVDYLYELEFKFKSGEISADNALELAIVRLIAK